MNYKVILLLILALLIDIALGIIKPGVGPILLIVAAFYISIKLSYFEAIILSLFSGFLYDICLLDLSIFNTVFLGCIALCTKPLSNRVIDFSSRSIQLISVVFLLIIKMLIFYLIYDRSYNSVYITNNLAAFAVAIALMITFLIIRKRHV